MQPHCKLARISLVGISTQCRDVYAGSGSECVQGQKGSSLPLLFSCSHENGAMDEGAKERQGKERTALLLLSSPSQALVNSAWLMCRLASLRLGQQSPANVFDLFRGEKQGKQRSSWTKPTGNSWSSSYRECIKLSAFRACVSQRSVRASSSALSCSQVSLLGAPIKPASRESVFAGAQEGNCMALNAQCQRALPVF